MKKVDVRLLIVDDEPEIRESLLEMLSSEGYDCDVASTGQEALDKIKVIDFDLALVDVRLPDMDGTKLVSQIHENNSRMINIMVTGYPALENAVNALNLGAQGYIVKPVDPVKLLNLIEKKIAKREKSEEISEDKMVDWVKRRVQKISELDMEK